jgi:transcriptional regulator with XRE-family HTH domain
MQAQANSEPGEERRIYRRVVSRRFGRYLATARRQAGISQQALADQAAVTRDDIGRYERGLVCPRLDTALRIAKSLDHDPLSFFAAVVGAVETPDARES